MRPLVISMKAVAAASLVVFAPFLRAHPEFSWQAPLLRDMKAAPWTRFAAEPAMIPSSEIDYRH
jgi:hypothetical protein